VKNQVQTKPEVNLNPESSPSLIIYSVSN